MSNKLYTVEYLGVQLECIDIVDFVYQIRQYCEVNNVDIDRHLLSYHKLMDYWLNNVSED
jgi:hypothetical protein